MGIIGTILIFFGLIWDIVFPINKSLWTSSYVLYTTGLATVFLTILYYIIDIANYKKRFQTIFNLGRKSYDCFLYFADYSAGFSNDQFSAQYLRENQLIKLLV
jgi:predicted acyltransferase